MANLQEKEQWDDGIYQIETSDPVLGGPDGVANRAAKSLANRTIWLKQQAGQTAETLAEHINDANPHSQYAQLDSPTLIGAPKTTTPMQFDNSQRIANTAFIKATGLQYGDSIYLRNATTLTADAAGKHFNLSGLAAGFSVTLPPAASVPAGTCITMLCSTLFDYTVKPAGSDKITPNGTPIDAIQMRNGDSLILVSNGTNYWQAIGGSVQYRYSESFAGVGLFNGYQKLPSGIILQWGATACAAGTSTNIAFPIAFPNNCLSITAAGMNVSGNTQAYVTLNSKAATGAVANCFWATNGVAPSIAQIAGSVQIWWQAIGY